MIVATFALIGIVIGVLTARRRKGTNLDLAHYGAGYGIAFAILGLIVAIAARGIWG